MFHHDSAIWFLNRRLKSESLQRKESSIASKTSKRVTASFERYFLLVRPLEKELVYHVQEGDNNREKIFHLYSEYMWVQAGEKLTPKYLYKSISSFMRVECKANVGVCSYRQICVEIGRVFLGSEAEIEAEEHDLLAIQMGHSLQMARANYALEAGHLPGMSSDLLLRFGRISEAWWKAVAIERDIPPLEPLLLRKQRAAEAVSKHQTALQDLLTIATLLNRRSSSDELDWNDKLRVFSYGLITFEHSLQYLYLWLSINQEWTPNHRLWQNLTTNCSGEIVLDLRMKYCQNKSRSIYILYKRK